MGPLARILLGLLILSIGILMVYKADWFLSNVGSVGWAEKTFGGGGSRFFYKLFGVCMTTLGIIVTLNLFNILFGPVLLSLFGAR